MQNDATRCLLFDLVGVVCGIRGIRAGHERSFGSQFSLKYMQGVAYFAIMQAQRRRMIWLLVLRVASNTTLLGETFLRVTSNTTVLGEN